LPGLIGDSFFRVLDENKDGYINFIELITGLSKVYFGDFNEKIKYIFDMYDFDGNGLITKEDIRTMMSYVPLATFIESRGRKEGLFTRGGGGHEDYRDRKDVQADLLDLFKVVLSGKESITITEFKEIICKSSSDMFLCLFLLIRERLPNMEAFTNYKKDFKFEIKNVAVPTAVIASPRLSKLAPSMNVLSKSPQLKSTAKKGNMLSPSSIFNKYLASPPKAVQPPQSTGEMDCPLTLEKPHKEKVEKEEVKSTEILEASRLPNVSIQTKLGGRTDIMLSPSAVLNKRPLHSSMAVCSCGNLCEIGKDKCANCLSKCGDVKGFLYFKKEGKLKRYWVKLLNKSLYGKNIT
jgi:Ca2+-binding EF-hand superfamily protein